MIRRTPMRRSWFRRKPAKNTIPLGVRAAVLERADNRCERCGVVAPLELHHRKKRSQGGEHTESNLAAVCRPCHQAIEGNPATAVREGWTVQRKAAA